MRRRGESAIRTQKQALRPRSLEGAQGRERRSFRTRIARSLLAVALAAGVLPLVPGAPAVETANALAGTTDYEKYFTWEDRVGSPTTAPVNGRLRVASTERDQDYAAYSDSSSSYSRMSSGVFISKSKISLKHNWELRFVGEISDPIHPANANGTNHYLFTGLSSVPKGAQLQGCAVGIKKSIPSAGKAVQRILQSQPIYNSIMNNAAPGSGGSGLSQVNVSSFGNSVSVVVSYDSATDRLTFSAGGSSIAATSCKRSFGSGSQDEAYLFFGGHIRWNGKNSLIAPGSRSLNVALTFQSMALPHFDPTIKDIKIYRVSDGTLIGPDDNVTLGTAVRVEVVLQNTNADAGNEQFPLHLKLLDSTHDKYPTVGLTPTGAVATSTGQAVTLTGKTETKVTFNATINGSAGAAASIGLQLVDDSFGGTYEAGAQLLSKHPLKPGDGSGSGKPGTDYHYTRLPAPNANGWNNSPVTVTFYPGDFDQMELAPSDGATATLTGDDPAWTRTDDTAGLSLSAQAKNTATGATSTQRAGSVKIDTSAPRIERDAALSAWTITDNPTDASKVTSGVWRLYRTNSSGASAADARAAAFREFALTGDAGDRHGEETQAVGNLPNGYYVAEDAAGNRSAPVKVGDTEPPQVERPAGSIVDPDDPNPPTPVGPPVGPGDTVPDPSITEDEEGLRHAVIEETVSEIIDPAAPPFAGSLDAAKATAMMDYRYASTSAAAPTTQRDELLDAAGSPLDSLDTTAPGECLIRRTITDAEGNTTTILLHYRLTRDSCPVIRPLEPVDPDDPTGPTEPGEPLEPDGPVTRKPDGTQYVEVSCEATEAASRGTMDADGAADLLRRHFAFASADGSDGATLEVQSMENASGGKVGTIDLSRPADYRITYLVRDAEGNTTAVRLIYHLIASNLPGVLVTPDPGSDLDPQPGDDPLHPQPRPLDPAAPPTVAPDGTQHAVMEDVMKVPVEEGAQLTLADARALVERRYTFTPLAGDQVHEVSLELADSAGTPVEAIDRSRPGAWVITYKVADGAGSTITLHLRYLVVTDPPIVTPTDPEGPGSGDDGNGGGDGDGPGSNGGDGSGSNGGGSDGNGGGSGGRDPLPPTSSTVDPETGLTHAVVEDHLIAGTSDEPLTSEAAAALIASRYQIAASMGGEVSAGEVRITDAAGAPAEAIDRTKPGVWHIEQVFTDRFGNTTTLRLIYEVREGFVDGGISGGDGPAGDPNGPSVSEAGPSSHAGAKEDDGSRWASRLRQLPQTGGIFGPCPLHIMFVLIIVLASAYSMMRLRQEASNRREDSREALG